MQTNGSRGNAGYAAFRAALLDGRLSPGANLTQAELCDVLGMSLSPLRDTLTLLEADALVTVRHRAGITVVNPDVAFIRRNFRFRTMIEREALPIFAEVVESDWLAQTITAHETVRDKVAAGGKVPKLEQQLRNLDWNFHSAIVSALRNTMITETHYLLQENLKLARVLNEDIASPSKATEALGEHCAILEQLSKRDSQGALEALEAHFRAAIHRAFGG